MRSRKQAALALRLALCLSCTAICPAQEKAAAKYPEKRLSTVLGRANAEDLAHAFEVHWERETLRLQKLGSLTDGSLAEGSLTDGEITAITAKILPLIRPTAKRVADADDNKYYDYTYGLFAMRRELEQVLTPILAESLGPKKFAQFQQDLATRRAMRKSWIVGSVASTINASVALDEDQSQQLIVILNDEFRVTWAVAALNYRPHDHVVPALDDSIRSLLNDQQLKAWDVAAKYLHESYPVKSVDEEAAMATFRQDLGVCIDTHADTLSRTLDLDERQLRKLRILGKGIEEELFQRRVRARAKYSDPTVRVVTPATSSDARNSPGTMLVAHPKWQAHVINVLTDEQKKTFLRWQAARRSRQVARLAGTMVRRLSSDIGLTSEQARKLQAVVDSSFPLDTSEPSIHGRLGIAIGPIPRGEVERILGSEQSWIWPGVYRTFLRDVRPNRDD